MKKAVKILAFSVAAVLTLTLCACGTKDFGTKIYGSTDLSEYVTLGNYKGLSVDKSTETFNTVFNTVVENDVSKFNITEKITEGEVRDGDVVNIDYVGKRKGVAFDGGTAQGYDLTIGSNSFIAGFESGLIGAKIGSTVDLHLTFPENYGNAELAGAAVVFTVTVNYVKSSEAVNMENHYAEAGYDSYEEYKAAVEKRAAQSLLFEQVLNASKVEKYPESDKQTFVNAVYKYREKFYKDNYSVDFETVLQYNGMTTEDYKKQLNDSAESQLKDQMIYYAIFQKEELKLDYELPDSDKTGQAVLDEITTVENVVKNYLYDNAKIKG